MNDLKNKINSLPFEVQWVVNGTIVSEIIRNAENGLFLSDEAAISELIESVLSLAEKHRDKIEGGQHVPA